MFYDHFDKLPPIIDDANQETYFAVTSTKAFQENDESVMEKLKQIPNMNLIPESLVKTGVNMYYCGLCGFAVFACGVRLEKMGRRKLDQSIVIDLGVLRSESKDLIFEYFLLQGRCYILWVSAGVYWCLVD